MNKEIEVLENDIYFFERDYKERVDELRVRIEHIRSLCNHERDDSPYLTNPWWCGKCGGLIAGEPALDRLAEKP